ncbi:thioredoxin reductase [Paenibacillus harenae]|uniref:Thioredoxin reductase n=1 Tax=Paenibacillus harenae TaxID=306543 RepID=A0ABT9U4S2_PAEHA|nr:thioredoxin reductase [Paenibacillus harenae]
MVYDCAIVGGGPAGLNAALVLGRARRNVVLLDDNKPRNAVTHASHGFITRDGVQPAEFRRIAHEELSRYPSVHYRQTEVTDVERTENGFRISAGPEEPVEAHKLLLATGLREIFPPIAGLRDFYGRSLFNCPYCDGWELRDKPLVVVSDTPHIFHYAKTIFNWSQDLVVCTRASNLTSEQAEALRSKGITVVDVPIEAFVGHEGRLEYVRFEDGSQIARAGGFIAPKWVQKSKFGEQLGCQLNEMGGIVTDSFGRSSVAGIYAAGLRCMSVRPS